MTGYFLSQLEIEGFRGINNENEPLKIRFKSNAINSIFAPNGLGKSSIFEAVCYAIKGYVPKLKRLPAAERADDYYCNRFHSGGDATIDLEFEPDDGSAPVKVRVQRTSAGQRIVTSPTRHADPEGLLHLLDDEFVLLDADTFASFILDSPLERGRSFAGLLGMSSLSDMRQALEALANTRSVDGDFDIQKYETEAKMIGGQIDTCSQNIRIYHDKLIGRPPAEPLELNSMITAASEALKGIELLKDSIQSGDLMSFPFDVLVSKVKDAEGGDDRARLASILASLEQLAKLAALADEVTELSDYKALVEQREKALSSTAGRLLKDLYEADLRVLESPDWTDKALCPACELTPDMAPSEFVTARLEQYAEVASLEGKLAVQWKSSKVRHRAQSLQKLFENVATVSGFPFKSEDSKAETGTLSVTGFDAFAKHLSHLDLLRNQKVSELSAEKATIEERLPPSLVALLEQLEYARQLRDAIKIHRELGVRHQQIGDKLSQRKRWKQFIAAACKCFADAETKLSQHLTKTIESQYQQFFSQVMAGGQVVPSLQKAPNSEQLHLKLDQFFGLTGLSATSLLSESYRNALAVSIYLSSALQRTTTARFVILDDITSSFDAGHQFALMEILRTKIGLPGNPSGMQVILLSHDGLLEKYFDKQSGGTGWHHIRLHGWPPQGFVFGQSQEAERLRKRAEQLIKAGQVKEAEPLIRQYLEYRLLQIITKVRVSVKLDFAIRDHMHMVSNCLDAIQDDLLLHKAASKLVLTSQQELDVSSVHVPALVGNWVSHYETAVSTSISPPVLLGVLDSIDTFASCFKYVCNCSGSPVDKYYKSLSAKQCPC